MGTCVGRARGNHLEWPPVLKTPPEISHLVWWLRSSSNVPAWRWWHMESPMTQAGTATSSSPVPGPGWGAACVPPPALDHWVGSHSGGLFPHLARGLGGVFFSSDGAHLQGPCYQLPPGNVERIIFPFLNNGKPSQDSRRPNSACSYNRHHTKEGVDLADSCAFVSTVHAVL